MIALEPRCYAAFFYDIFLFWVFAGGFYTLGAPIHNFFLQFHNFFL